MNILIVGLQKTELERYVKEHYQGYNFVEKNPEVVLCYGGDGTLLYGERHYPGVPKVLIRNSQICNICADMSKETVLRLVLEKKFHVSEYIKLQAQKDNQVMVGLNDIIVGHPKVNGTLRAKIYIDNMQYKHEFIGDGIVAATPIGSTAYYQSITRSNFASGIGIAFNNTVTLVGHLVVTENSVIEVEITRGPAIATTDNGEDEIPLSTGDHITIKRHDQTAKIIHFSKEYSSLNMTASTNRLPWGFCQLCRRLYVD